MIGLWVSRVFPLPSSSKHYAGEVCGSLHFPGENKTKHCLEVILLERNPSQKGQSWMLTFCTSFSGLWARKEMLDLNSLCREQFKPHWGRERYRHAHNEAPTWVTYPRGSPESQPPLPLLLEEDHQSGMCGCLMMLFFWCNSCSFPHLPFSASFPSSWEQFMWLWLLLD